MWIGEQGVLVAIVLLIAALLLQRFWKPFQPIKEGAYAT